MNNYEEYELREEFKKLLYKLAEFDSYSESNNMYDSIYLDFASLYSKNYNNSISFRHYYSDIFGVLTDIWNSNLSKGCIENMTTRLDRVISNGESYDYLIIKKIKKLYDHIDLEQSRINYFYNTIRNTQGIHITDMKEEFRKLTDKIDESSKQLKKQDTKTKTMEKKYSTMEKKVNEYQKEYISILSIFSSVVLAFIGGMVFSTSILENIHKMNIFIGLSVISLLGIVLSNILLLLFNFISRLIYYKRSFIKDSYYIIFNGVMLSIFIGSMFLYFAIKFLNKIVSIFCKIYVYL